MTNQTTSPGVVLNPGERMRVHVSLPPALKEELTDVIAVAGDPLASRILRLANALAAFGFSQAINMKVQRFDN